MYPRKVEERGRLAARCLIHLHFHFISIVLPSPVPHLKQFSVSRNINIHHISQSSPSFLSLLFSILFTIHKSQSSILGLHLPSTISHLPALPITTSTNTSTSLYLPINEPQPRHHHFQTFKMKYSMVLVSLAASVCAQVISDLPSCGVSHSYPKHKLQISYLCNELTRCFL